MWVDLLEEFFLKIDGFVLGQRAEPGVKEHQEVQPDLRGQEGWSHFSEHSRLRLYKVEIDIIKSCYTLICKLNFCLLL